MFPASLGRGPLAGRRDTEGNTLATKHQLTLKAHITKREKGREGRVWSKNTARRWRGGGSYRGTDGAENELSDSLNARTPDIAAIHGHKQVTALHLGLELGWGRRNARGSATCELLTNHVSVFAAATRCDL